MKILVDKLFAKHPRALRRKMYSQARLAIILGILFCVAFAVALYYLNSTGRL